MSKKATVIKTTGKVIECLPNTMFKIKLENGNEAIGHLSGKMRINSIKIVEGDSVELELSIYDLTKGRIVTRIR